MILGQTICWWVVCNSSCSLLIHNLGNTVGLHFLSCFYKFKKAIIALLIAFFLPPSFPQNFNSSNKNVSANKNKKQYKRSEPKIIVFYVICQNNRNWNDHLLSITLYWWMKWKHYHNNTVLNYLIMYIQIFFVWSFAQWYWSNYLKQYSSSQCSVILFALTFGQDTVFFSCSGSRCFLELQQFKDKWGNACGKR